MYASDFRDVLTRKTVGAAKWPTVDDFENGEVWVPPKEYNALLSKIRRKKPVVIVGAEGRGKSVLAKKAGFHFLHIGENVQMIDCTVPGEQSIDSIIKVMANLDSGGASPIWIVEDIQNDEERMARLYPQIEKCRSSRFIYVWRQTLSEGEREIEADTDWINELLKTAELVRLRPSTESVQQIIKGYTLSSRNPDRFAAFPGAQPDECKHLFEISGGNLRSLGNYLEMWDPRTVGLGDLESTMILKSVWRSTLNPLLKLGEATLETYVNIAAVGQLDLNARADGFGVAALQELKQKGLISEYYGFEHATDAKLVIDAFANQTNRRSHDITNDLLAKYLAPFCVDDVVIDSNLGAHLIQLMRGVQSLSIAASAALSQRFGQLVVKSKGCVAKTEYIKSFCKDRNALWDFIESLGGIGFADTLIQAKDAKIIQFLFTVRLVDRSLAKEFETALVKLFVRCEARRLANSFTFFQNSERSRELAKAILTKLGTDDSSQLIKTASIASCGKLMGAAQQIDKEKAHTLAFVVADNCVLRDADSAETLSRLIRNLRFNEIAYSKLLNRVVSESDVSRLFSNGEIDGFSFLLAAVVAFRERLDQPHRANIFARAIKTGFTLTRLSRLSDRSLAALLYSFLLLNEPIGKWLKEIESDLCERVRRMKIEHAFLLLWNILQADEAFFRQLVSQVKVDLGRFIATERLGYLELGLIGHLAYAGIEVSGPFGNFSCGDVATELMKNDSASKVLFALLGARHVSNSVHADLLLELQGRVDNFNVTVAQLISKNPNIQSRNRLMSIASQMGYLTL